MKMYKDLTFEVLNREDIDSLTPIMKRAFDEDTKRHLNEEAGGPPGYDNGDFLRRYALDRRSTAYKVSMDNKLVGAIIVWINSSNRNYLGNMFVDTGLQDQGIGSRIWEFVERQYPETKVWETETPAFSKRNHNFYINKCGFHVVKILNPMDKYEASYVLKKECYGYKNRPNR